MFTGLVKETGVILSVISNTEGKKLLLRSRELIKSMEVNDSISINGVCQTVVRIKGEAFEVQCVHTTLKKTTLGRMRPGVRVNLELALRWRDRMGGHLMQGHINGIGTVSSIRKTGKNSLVKFDLSSELFEYVIEEGSIAIDGVSLTVAEVFQEKNSFEVSIIPHTLEKTTFSNLKRGDKVNIEVDIVAKYVKNFLVKGTFGKDEKYI